MKLISEHLGQIIAVLAAVALLICVVVGFKAPIGDFFGGIVVEETLIGNNIMSNLDDVDLTNLSDGGNNSEEASETTYYTEEKIASDEHLFAIGATNENYVVAAFSNDYSSVTITKNGDESDGLMQNYSSSNSSPIVTINNQYSVYSVDIKDGVVNIGDYTFFECYEISGLSIANSVTSIGQYAFNGCSNLYSVTLPANLKTIGNRSFQYTGISKLIIPDGVESIGNKAFSSCYSLMSVYVPSSVTIINYEAFTYMGIESCIYCETQDVMDLMYGNYSSTDTVCVVDQSKFI